MIKRKVYKLGILLCLALCSAGLTINLAKGEGKDLKPKGAWQNFTSTSLATCMVEDNEFIWIGTAGGLNQFSKKEMRFIKTYTTADGLPDNMVRQLVVDGSTLWIGAGGLATLDIRQGKITQCDLGIDLSLTKRRNWDQSLCLSGVKKITKEDNFIWVVADESVGRNSKSKIWCYTKAKESWMFFDYNTRINTVVADAEDEDCLWVGTSKGLMVFDKCKQYWASPPEGFDFSGDNITKIVVDKSNVWLVSMPHPWDYGWSVRLPRGDLTGSFKSVTTMVGYGDSFSRKSDFKAGISEKARLVRYDKKLKKYLAYRKENGLTGNIIKSIASAGDSLWVITDSFYSPEEKRFRDGGVNRFDYLEGKWKNYNVINSFPTDITTSLEISNDAVWISTANYDKCYETLEGWDMSFHKFARPNITEVVVHKYDQKKKDWVSFPRKSLDNTEMIRRVFKRGNSLWSFSKLGKECWQEKGILSKYQPSKKEWSISLQDEQFNEKSMNIVHSAASGLWAYTEKGLFKLAEKQDKWLIIPNEDKIAAPIVTSIAVGKDYVWFGTIGGGISRYDKNNGTWKIIRQKDGLPTDYVSSLSLNPKEKLWAVFNEMEVAEKTDNPEIIRGVKIKMVSGIGKYDRDKQKWTVWGPKDELVGYDYWIYDTQPPWQVMAVDGWSRHMGSCIITTDRDVYVTINHGLNRFGNGKWQNYTTSEVVFLGAAVVNVPKNSDIPGNTIMDMAADGKDLYVLVTFFTGLTWRRDKARNKDTMASVLANYDREEDKWETLWKSPVPAYGIQISRNGIYILSAKDLLYFDLKKRQSQVIKTHQRISCWLTRTKRQWICLDGNRLWHVVPSSFPSPRNLGDWLQGGQGGLIKYDISKDIQEMFFSKDGLVDNEIWCIANDDNYLWIGTSNGVSRIDKARLK